MTTKTTGVSSKIPKAVREVRLAKHLQGELALDNFDLVEVEAPQPGEGEVLVRTDYLGLAATYLYLMKTDSQLPVAPWKVGERIGGSALGTVVGSYSADLAAGDLVQTMAGWCEYSVGPAHQYYKIDPDLFPSPAYYLSQGATAYYGMVEIAKTGKNDVVFVSGAAGGVGSLAGQIAKCRGAEKVIGSAGSKAKVDYLVNELRYDAAFDYHDGPVIDHLRELAPDGINVFFDTVGGEQLEAAIQVAAPHARFALCGALSVLIGNKMEAFSREALVTAITQHLELRPFGGEQFEAAIQAAWIEHFSKWLGEGRFVFPHTIVEGSIQEAPQALIALLKGKYKGNVSMKVAAG